MASTKEMTKKRSMAFPNLEELFHFGDMKMTIKEHKVNEILCIITVGNTYTKLYTPMSVMMMATSGTTPKNCFNSESDFILLQSSH